MRLRANGALREANKEGEMRCLIRLLITIALVVPAYGESQTVGPSITFVRADDVPPLQHATVFIAQAQVATLFSSPVEIVPAQSGKIILPIYIHIRKAAGTAWTTTNSGVLAVGYAGSSNIFSIFNQSLTDGFFGSNEQIWLGGGSGGANNSGVSGFVTSAAAYNGTAIVLRLSTANISNGTGTITAQIWYRVWDGL